MVHLYQLGEKEELESFLLYVFMEKKKNVSFLKHFHFVMDLIFWQLCELKLRVRTEPQAEQDLSNLPECKLGQLVRTLIRQQLQGTFLGYSTECALLPLNRNPDAGFKTINSSCVPKQHLAASLSREQCWMVLQG